MDRKFIGRVRIAALAGALVVGALASGSAFAQHHRGHGHGPRVSLGFYVGAPFYPYYYRPYYYAPYYYPPVVVAPAQPPVYIEQALPAPDAAPQPAPSAWWYYCAGAQGYYPQVDQCPGGWQKVAPQPPG